MKGTLACSRHLPWVRLGGQSGNSIPTASILCAHEGLGLPSSAWSGESLVVLCPFCPHPASTVLLPQGIRGGVHVHWDRNGSCCCL